MAEPTTTLSAAAVAATISGFTSALLGVDYYSLIWGMVGALLALYQASPMGKVRSVVLVSISTLAGAACGTGAVDVMGSESRPLLIVASLVAGFGAQRIVAALLQTTLNRIEKLGGQ